MNTPRIRSLAFLILLAGAGDVLAQAPAPPEGPRCGEVVEVPTHDGTTTRYAYAPGTHAHAADAPLVLVLLAGGGGDLGLDERGCPRRLNRNVLVRMLPLLHEAGVATALVDAPSDLHGGDGLGGFRVAAAHARDLGRVIADVRMRTNARVWVVGHSRGTISAVNAAARLAGPAAPHGVILLSAMLVGDTSARKPWVAQTVFTVDPGAIEVPLLVIGHAADHCVRSPAHLMSDFAATTRSVRPQVITVTGGSIPPGGLVGLIACDVESPHDFAAQQAEVAAAIVRFVHGSAD